MDCFASLAMTRIGRGVLVARLCHGIAAGRSQQQLNLFHGRKTGYACRRFTEDFCLTPDNDPSPAPFGALAPNAAQAAIISLAHRTRLKRGAFPPWLSPLVHLLRAGPVHVPYPRAPVH